MIVQQPLVCLDVESTGVWVEKDRMIEVAFVKFLPGGGKETFYKRVNPGLPIPPAVTELTGISDADVQDAPPFKAIAREAFEFLADADLAGFNIERFDLPLLEREFAEAGFKFDWKCRKIYDAQKVFHLNEKRDLTAAYKFYCNKDLEGAHSALADSEAVLEILERQVEKYGEGSPNIDVLDKFEYSATSDYYDNERKFCWWQGKLYLMFGKYRRQKPLEELAKSDPGYLNWVLNADFSDSVKSVIRNALKGEFPLPPAG